MKTKHTPGPWHMEPTSNDPKTGIPYFYHVNKNHQNIGSFNENEFVGVSNADAHANAVLASAAPEMLEILQELHAKIDWGYDFWPENEGQEIKSRLEELIQKATS